MPLGLGRRKDDQPPSPFGGNTGTVRVRALPVDPRAERARMVTAGPGPDARSVAGPRAVALVGWTLLVALGPGFVLTGETEAVIFGGLWTVGLGALFVMLLRMRVVVDGHELFVRRRRRWQPPVDLSNLRSATVVVGGNLEQRVELTDRHGGHVQVDAINLRLKRLYRELATYIAPEDGIADKTLQRRIGRHR
jgi:hypothetical protein